MLFTIIFRVIAPRYHLNDLSLVVLEGSEGSKVHVGSEAWEVLKLCEFLKILEI